MDAARRAAWRAAQRAAAAIHMPTCSPGSCHTPLQILEFIIFEYDNLIIESTVQTSVSDHLADGQSCNDSLSKQRYSQLEARALWCSYSAMVMSESDSDLSAEEPESEALSLLRLSEAIRLSEREEQRPRGRPWPKGRGLTFDVVLLHALCIQLRGLQHLMVSHCMLCAYALRGLVTSRDPGHGNNTRHESRILRYFQSPAIVRLRKGKDFD